MYARKVQTFQRTAQSAGGGREVTRSKWLDIS